MPTSRREFLRLGSLLTAAASGTVLARAQQSVAHEHEHGPQAPVDSAPPAGTPRASAVTTPGSASASPPPILPAPVPSCRSKRRTCPRFRRASWME